MPYALRIQFFHYINVMFYLNEFIACIYFLYNNGAGLSNVNRSKKYIYMLNLLQDLL